MPCTRHRVTLRGDTRSGETGSEHFMGTGRAGGPGAGSQTAPGLGGRELWITFGDLQGSLTVAAGGGGGGMAAMREAARMKCLSHAFLSSISQLVGFLVSGISKVGNRVTLNATGNSLSCLCLIG